MEPNRAIALHSMPVLTTTQGFDRGPCSPPRERNCAISADDRASILITALLEGLATS